MHNIGKNLGQDVRQLDTDNEVDYTRHDAGTSSLEQILETGVWNDIFDFDTICSSVHVFLSHFEIDSFSGQVPWT